MYYGNPKNRTIRDAQPCCCKCGKTLKTQDQVKVCYKNPHNSKGEQYGWWDDEKNCSPKHSYYTQSDKWIYKCKWCGTEQEVTIKIKSKVVEYK